VGEAIVRRFATGGAMVGTTARSPLPEGSSAQFFVQADISTRDGVDKVVREMLHQFGSLDILIHNAGWFRGCRRRVLVLSDADWQDRIRHEPIRRVRPRSRFSSIYVAASSGVIIHVSSISARFII